MLYRMQQIDSIANRLLTASRFQSCNYDTKHSIISRAQFTIRNGRGRFGVPGSDRKPLVLSTYLDAQEHLPYADDSNAVTPMSEENGAIIVPVYYANLGTYMCETAARTWIHDSAIDCCSEIRLSALVVHVAPVAHLVHVTRRSARHQGAEAAQPLVAQPVDADGGSAERRRLWRSRWRRRHRRRRQRRCGCDGSHGRRR